MQVVVVLVMLGVMAIEGARIDNSTITDPNLCSQPPLGTPQYACRAACVAAHGPRWTGEQLVTSFVDRLPIAGECERHQDGKRCQCHPFD